MPLTAIAALDPDRVIGKDGLLPWHLPEDLRLFKKLTLGHPIIMGRTTWESLPRHPLPGRENIVLTRQADYTADGARVLHGIDALAPWRDGDAPAFLIGGATLYSALLPACEEIILTHVKDSFPGDVWFPAYEDMFIPAETLVEGERFRTVRYRRRER